MQYYYLILFVIIGRDAVSFYTDCSLDDGSVFHVLPYSGCQRYYSCNSGTVNYYQCPEGTIFNYHLNKCSTSGSCYELVCAGRRDGSYSDTTENCTRYYNCAGGLIRSLHSCPSGTIFSNNSCQPASASKCEPLEAALSHHKRDLCENSLDGYHPLVDCSSYVYCSGGFEEQIFSCPFGLKFNGTHCSENVTCANFCSNKPDGYIYDIDSGCSEYIYCKDGIFNKRFKCPAGTIFNGESCVIETMFQCPQLNRCKGIANGSYSDYSLSCKSYYQCKNGQIEQRQICDDNLVWNGEKCVSEKEFHCVDPMFSIDCLGKVGFFSDKTNCSNYFYCSFGMKTIFSCREQSIFNGTHCVKSIEYTCPNLTENSCEGKQEGYYMNTESNCQSYYYCARGNKLVYVCPIGQIYNGEECVSELSYSCPFSSIECKNLSNGYHKSQSSISEFIYCQNEVKLNTFRCNTNEIFDGEKCSVFNDKNNLCHQIKKGYVSFNNCRTYHLCKEYVIMETNTCPSKHIFNGNECVPQEKFICPNTDCSNLRDGFYQDFQSDCHNYFYCINGYKTILACPPSEIHNGNMCVPEDTYSCQSKFTSNDINVT